MASFEGKRGLDGGPVQSPRQRSGEGTSDLNQQPAHGPLWKRGGRNHLTRPACVDGCSHPWSPHFFFKRDWALRSLGPVHPDAWVQISALPRARQGPWARCLNFWASVIPSVRMEMVTAATSKGQGRKRGTPVSAQPASPAAAR